MSLAGPVSSTGTRSFKLPLSFAATGVAAFLVLNVLFTAGAGSIMAYYFRNTYLLLVTHLFTLGFVTSVIMGAMYQLVPVILETPLHSQRLGFVQFGVYMTGVALMLVGFPTFAVWWIAVGGSLVLISVVLFIWNIALTMRKAPGWHMAGTYLIFSLIYLSLLVTWGVLLAFNLKFQFFGLATRAELLTHVAFGFAGWFTNTIMGVSYRLIPLFTLAHLQAGPISKTVLILFNVGVFGLAAGASLSAPNWALALALALITSALGLYIYDARRMIRSRIRREIDISIRYGTAASTFLILSLLLAGWLLLAPGEQAASRYVAVLYAAGLGWVSLTIAGQMYKILPFLIWTGRYAPRAGKEKVPMLREMFSERVSRWSYFSLIAGVALTTIGLWFGWVPLTYAGSSVVMLGSALFGYGMWQVFTR